MFFLLIRVAEMRKVVVRRKRGLLRRFAWVSALPVLIGFQGFNDKDSAAKKLEIRAIYFQGAPVSSVPPIPIATVVTLPSLNQALPNPAEPEYDNQIRAMGLDPEDVRSMAELARREPPSTIGE